VVMTVPSLPSTFEELLASADDAAEAATNREPTDNSWGMRLHDNPNFVLANDFTFFFWFETREALLDYVEQTMVLQGSEGATEEDLRAVCNAAAAVARKARESGAPIAAGTTFDILGRTQTVEWMGRFVDLLNGANALEIALRREFRDGDDEASDIAIEADERDDFVDFLRSYGM